MLINMIGFNLAWFGLVYWGNSFIAIAIILLVAHLTKLSKVKYEKKLVFMVIIIGASIDCILSLLHIFSFNNSDFIPAWLIVLWACFACTLCHSLNFLSHSKLLQIFVGGLLAPISYLSASALGAVEFLLSSVQTYLILALIWSFLFYLFYFLKNTLMRKEQGAINE